MHDSTKKFLRERLDGLKEELEQTNQTVQRYTKLANEASNKAKDIDDAIKSTEEDLNIN